ncbi:hypothetical protein [Flavobacterium sp. WC2509]|uniref:hypothetical protein n=1 Tax=Flavobacterium sp. WC2509 TaxID=3461406 RepID=UPI004043EC4D
MNKNYFDSEGNTAFLTKTIKLLLMSFLFKNVTRIKFIYTFLLLVLFANFANAATYYSRVTTGNFATVSSWSTSPSGSPTNGAALASGDTFIIQNGHTITVAANIQIANITVQAGGFLIVGAFNFRVDNAALISGTITHNNTAGTKSYRGSVTIDSSGTWNNTGNSDINFRGGITNNGTFNSGTGAHTFTNNAQTLNGILSITNLTCSDDITNNGTLTISTTLAGTGTLINTGTLNFGVTSITPTLDATSVGNIVNYNATGVQTVKSTTYSNLTLSGSGTKTLGGAVATNAALTLNNNTSLAMSTYLLTLNGDLINNGSGTITGTTGGVTISGTATQNIAGFTTTGAVSMIKTTGGAATLTGNVNGASLTINGSGGIMSLGTGLTHTFTGDWSRGSGTLNGGSSTLKIGGDVTGTGSTFTAETSTVEFNKTGAQNLGSAALTYNNLILSGSGDKTLGAVATVSNTWSIISPVKANLGAITTHAATTLYLHGTGPLSASWGAVASTTATNKTNAYFTTGITGRINVASVIDNNYASYNNATGDLGGGIVGENTGPLVLTAPDGSVFINTKFASYGTPGGIYPNFTIGGCHAPTSRAKTTELLGNTTVTIPASGAFNDFFGDYCNGTIKTYSVVATYALPICSGNSPGIITGSDPTGGNGTGSYSFVWSQSGTIGGTYTPISGATNRDYTPGTLTATTYYKRTVTSGIFSDETIVIVPVITAPASTAPTIATLCSDSTLSVPAPTIAGTYVEWFFGSCGSTVIGTGTTYNPTATGNYYARYTNRCGSSNCGVRNVATTPTNGVVVTPTNPTSICVTGTAQTASLPYTATGTPTTYSIIWSPSGFLINIANRNLPGSTSGSITLDIPSNVPAGTYTGSITVKTAAGCTSASKTFALTIGKVAGVASSTPTLCVNTALTAITHSTINATGIGTAIGLPTGVTAAWASNTITISGTPSVSGTFNYTIPLTGSCIGSADATGTITVRPVFTSGTIASTGETICYNGDPGLIGSTTAASGGDTTITYQWQSSTDAAFTTPVTIGSSNSATYDPPTGLTVNTWYRRQAKDGTCNTIFSNSTNTWAITVRANFTTGTIASTGETICYNGDPGAIGSTTAASGGDTTITYQWQSSTDAAFTTPVTIGSSNSATYDPPTGLTVNTWYRRQAKDGTCNTTFSNSTNTWAVTVRPTVTATISGTTSVCLGGTTSNVTFTNPLSSPITVTYNINGSGATTINVGANTTATIAAPTVTAGTFVYNLVSAVYQAAPTCTAPLTGSATITVRPTVSATISGTTSVCLGGTTPNVTFTNPLSDAITVTYNINGGISTTINVGANTTATVAAPTGTAGPFVYNLVSAVYQAAPTCSASLTGSATITVISNNTIVLSSAVGTDSQAVCVNTPITNITYTTTGATGATFANLPTGVSGSWAANVVIISGTPTVAGAALTYTVTLTGGCGSISATGTRTIIVNPLPTIPTASATAQPSCLISTGTITVSDPAPATGIEYTVTGISPVVAGVTNTTGIFSGLAAGTYNVTTSNTNTTCTSSASSTITINAIVTKTWLGGTTDWNTASNWSPSSVPIATDCVIIPNVTNKPVISGTNEQFYANVLTVNTDSSLTVNSTNTLTVTDVVRVQGTGTLTFENEASLVQVNDLATNSGSITYKRTTSAVNDYDYVYWSSPVVNRTLGQLSPTSDKYWSWLVDNWTPAKATDVMLPAKGYIVRVPFRNISTSSPISVVFSGVPNNGVKTIASQGVNKSNLIGNPYPSAIDADLFMNYNKTIINGSLYFWTHRVKRSLDIPNNQYIYAASDYAVYTLLGGAGSVDALRNIAAGQSFFVISKRSGNFTFNNSMRIATAGENNQFLKQASTKKGIASDRDRVWLNLTNDGGAFKQLLVGYMAEATNDFDNLYDGTTLDGNTFVDFYSIANAKNYTIQARGLPFNTADEIPLGYKTTVAGTFTIAIDKVDGGLTDQAIYLEDKTTNKIQNLKTGSYSFTTAIGTFTDRFVLRYTDTSKALGTEDAQATGKGVIVSVKNSQIKINSFDQTLSSVKVYDLKGSLLYEKNKVNKNEFVVDHLVSSNQFMIVMVQLEDGKWVTEEIIFHD